MGKTLRNASKHTLQADKERHETITFQTRTVWEETRKMQFAQAFGGFADRLHQQLIDHVMEVRELQAQDEISTDIFRRLNPVPLIDRYAVYQALADHWQSIIIDIETIQEEGIRAVREVETVYKLVKKKNDEEVEVPDGLKGRIIPFSMVQQMKFQSELQAIAKEDCFIRTDLSSTEEIIKSMWIRLRIMGFF